MTTLNIRDAVIAEPPLKVARLAEIETDTNWRLYCKAGNAGGEATATGGVGGRLMQ